MKNEKEVFIIYGLLRATVEHQIAELERVEIPKCDTIRDSYNEAYEIIESYKRTHNTDKYRVVWIEEEGFV